MTAFDQGLFEHEPGGHYLHRFREVMVAYRAFLRRMAAETGVAGAQFELLRQMALGGGRSATLELAREPEVDPPSAVSSASLRESVEHRAEGDCDERDADSATGRGT